jgi:hypothetical protein
VCRECRGKPVPATETGAAGFDFERCVRPHATKVLCAKAHQPPLPGARALTICLDRERGESPEKSPDYRFSYRRRAHPNRHRRWPRPRRWRPAAASASLPERSRSLPQGSCYRTTGFRSGGGRIALRTYPRRLHYGRHFLQQQRMPRHVRAWNHWCRSHARISGQDPARCSPH